MKEGVYKVVALLTQYVKVKEKVAAEQRVKMANQAAKNNENKMAARVESNVQRRVIAKTQAMFDGNGTSRTDYTTRDG